MKSSPLDTYSLKARLFPAFIMLSPIALGAIAWTPDGKIPLGSGLGMLAGAGLSFMLAEFVREIGQEKQKELWKSWGGPPTTQLLRHRNAEVNPLVRRKWRTRLEQITGTSLPSEGAEKSNPAQADLVYEAAVLHLREVKRGEAALAHAENTSYGFRRNLFVLKTPGIACCLLGLASCGISVVARNYGSPGIQITDVPIVCAIVIAFLLVLWISRVNNSWVRKAGFEYAQRLLSSQLSSPQDRSVNP